MSGIEAKDFAEPDETVTFDHGRADLVKIGSLAIGREVLEPGWRWSTHVKPIVGTEWCEFHHVTYLLSGRLQVVARDGESRELTGGEVMDLAPGHDAWVVGEEPVVTIDFQGIVGWAKAPEPGERVLTTILFTDIVASTAAAERLGDKAWERLLAAHQRLAMQLNTSGLRPRSDKLAFESMRSPAGYCPSPHQPGAQPSSACSFASA